MLRSIVAGALGVALGCFALPGVASAGSVPSPLAPGLTGPDLVVPIYHPSKYDRKKHGRRYKYKHGPYVHFYGGYWYASPWWWSVPSPYVVGPVVPVVGTPAWHAYCKAKYKTWDPRRGKWRNAKGVWVPCV